MGWGVFVHNGYAYVVVRAVSVHSMRFSVAICALRGAITAICGFVGTVRGRRRALATLAAVCCSLCIVGVVLVLSLVRALGRALIWVVSGWSGMACRLAMQCD